MKRLIEKTVLAGFVPAWRFAAWPTRRSPFLANATIEGVVRAPSLFSKTTGSPPSMTDIQELVVPKSIPKTLAIKLESFRGSRAGIRHPFSKPYSVAETPAQTAAVQVFMISDELRTAVRLSQRVSHSASDCVAVSQSRS